MRNKLNFIGRLIAVVFALLAIFTYFDHCARYVQTKDSMNSYLEQVDEFNKIEEDLENFRAVHYRMDNEGMDYCFESYSSWNEIEDEEFHKLRQEFLDSMKKIREYVDNKIDTLSEEIDDTTWGDY
jgi:hypothetical protein